MSKEQQFWKWFSKHNGEYLHLDDMPGADKEKVQDRLLKVLHEYCDKLYFQVGGHPEKDTRELVISAEGNLDYFDKVQMLVGAAPVLDKWTITAFKQPQGFDFVMEHEDIILNPQEMWFRPLTNKNLPEKTGLSLFTKNYDPAKKKHYLFAANQVLDTILGEMIYALNIHYVEINGLPADTKDLFPLSDLLNFLKWRKTRMNN